MLIILSINAAIEIVNVNLTFAYVFLFQAKYMFPVEQV